MEGGVRECYCVGLHVCCRHRWEYLVIPPHHHLCVVLSERLGVTTFIAALPEALKACKVHTSFIAHKYEQVIILIVRSKILEGHFRSMICWLKMLREPGYEANSDGCLFMMENKFRLELTKHITLHANGEPLLMRSSSHSHSSPVLQQFGLLSDLPMATVVLLLPRPVPGSIY